MNRYDPEDGAWSGFVEAESVTEEDMPEGYAYEPTLNGRAACAYQGEMYFLMDFNIYDKERHLGYHFYNLHCASSGTTDFEVASLEGATEESEALPYLVRAVATDDGIVAFGQLEDYETGNRIFALVSYDDETQGWHSKGEVSGAPVDSAGYLRFNAQGTAALAADNGIVLFGNIFSDGAEARFVNLETGSWGLLSVEGDVLADGAKVVPTGGVMTYKGYLVAGVGGDGASDGALYSVSFNEGAGVEHAVATLCAKAGKGGTAAVSGSGIVGEDSSLTILKGNNATWKAAAQKGYSFAGWYDTDGKLVSRDAFYTAAVAGDETLTARFTAAAKVGSKFTAGKLRYKVTAKGKVRVVGLTKAGRSAKSITVPAKVKNAYGASFKVTSIKAKALKQAKKARKITIGKNVSRIGRQAFKGSKAKTVTVKTKKLTKKRVKGCFKGSKVKIVKVKVGAKKANKSYAKKYAKIFTKKNSGKKVKVR